MEWVAWSGMPPPDWHPRLVLEVMDDSRNVWDLLLVMDGSRNFPEFCMKIFS